MPIELKYAASYFDDGFSSENVITKVQNFIKSNAVSIGGHLFINDTDIFFKPHSLNFGTSNETIIDGDNVYSVPHGRIIKISSITRYEKGMNPLILTIFSDTGHKMKLSVWKRNEIIDEIEIRKGNS